jgi:hypothetical protein
VAPGKSTGVVIAIGKTIVMLYCWVIGGPDHPESVASTENTKVPVDLGVPLKL